MRVAIIGAGICGLYLGWKLSEKGHKVIIFEKKDKIGKECCSGLFSERILEFIPESEKLIQNQIDYCLLYWKKRTLKIKFLKKFFVIERKDLDRLVASLGEKAGAKIILSQNIFISDLKMLKEKFERIIGCDGPSSEVRKSLGVKDPQFRLAMRGFIFEGINSNVVNSNFVEIWPQKGGFIWKIPRGKFLEYGIIGPLNCKDIFEDFLKKNNLKLEKLNSALVPQELVLPPSSSKEKEVKITLCGDALGLTKPWSGGGVVWSLIAANFLLRNFPDFLKYHQEIKKFFLPKIIFSKILTKTVYFLGFNFPQLFPKNLKIESDFLL